ncbi:MAG TPA: glycosyltransferase family 39 protein [Gemmatimonadaceae bacterium]|nr:glycosyltransferase family 39 protein [Gemmatimonadaceae bacterium]
MPLVCRVGVSLLAHARAAACSRAGMLLGTPVAPRRTRRIDAAAEPPVDLFGNPTIRFGSHIIRRFATSADRTNPSLRTTGRSTPANPAVAADTSDRSRSRLARIESVAWYLCVAILSAWAIGYVAWPFSNDQGNLAWVGDVIRSGGMPYRDAWDVKGPGAHLLFALVGGIFGRNEWGVRVFDLIVLGVGAWCLARLGQEYAGAYVGARGGRWAIVLYLLWYASLNYHNTAQPDAWAAVMLTVAVTVMVIRKHRLAALSGVVAGALIACAALIKPTYVLFLALPALEALVGYRAGERGRAVRFSMATVAGLAVPVLLCIGWFAARGALGDWADVHLRWIPTSYTQLDAAWLSRVQYVAAFLTTAQLAPAVPLAVGGLLVVRHAGRSRDALLLGAWVVVSLVGVLIQGNFFPYHWHPVYPPLALLAGLGIATLGDTIRGGQRTATSRQPDAGGTAAIALGRPSLGAAVALAAAVVLLVGTLINPLLNVYRGAKVVVGLSDMAAYDRVQFGPFGHHGGVFAELVDDLRVRSRPGEPVLVWGSGAGINFLTDRPAVLPFGFIQPLVDPLDTELRRRYRERFMRQLMSTPPQYVVALNERACARNPSVGERKLMGIAEGMVLCLGDFGALRDIVLDRYAVVRTFGSLELYERR